jgi:type VI secretion system secreted protein Hcp
MSNVVDCNLKIDGVGGESAHTAHAGEIEVLEWRWGVEQPSSAGLGGGASKGKAVPESFNFVHAYDKASPVLAKSCAAGKRFDSAVLTARKAGGDGGQLDFLKVTLKKVMITAVSPSFARGGEVAERVAMDYDDIEFEYKEQQGDNSLGGSVKFGWDIKTTATR